MQMGIRHIGYMEHRHILDYYNGELRRQAEEAARLLTQLEEECKRFVNMHMYYQHLAGPSGVGDDEEVTRRRRHRHPHTDG